MEKVVAGVRAGHDDFDGLRAAFRAAHNRRPDLAWRGEYQFARRRAHCAVVGGGLAALVERAFVHLAIASDARIAPALRVEAWDESETGVPAPVRLRGVQVTDAGRIVTAGSDAWVGAYDRASGHLVAAVRSHTALSYVDRARPFVRLLLIWYGDRGCQILHAGMVARSGTGIVVAGGAEAGKSTTVFACAHANFALLGDDCIAVQSADDREFIGFSVYSSLLVDPRTVRAFGGVGLPNDGDPRGRDLVYLDPAKRAMSSAAPVRAILLPVIVPGSSSRLESMGRGEVLRTLLPTVLAADSLGMGTRRGFDALTALLDSARCYRLVAGSDLHALPAVVGSVLGDG